MTVVPCQWTIVSLLKSHRYLPFSTMCPSLKAHGAIKWTGLKTMPRTHGFDATWLLYLKWPPKHRDQLYQQTLKGFISAIIYLSSFHQVAWGKSWASLGRAALKSCAQLLSWSEERRPHLEGNDYSPRHVWVLAVNAASTKCAECQGPRTAAGCQVGTVLLMALTCEIEEHRFFFYRCTMRKWETRVA